MLKTALQLGALRFDKSRFLTLGNFGHVSVHNLLLVAAFDEKVAGAC
jgi:hypothetical protein